MAFREWFKKNRRNIIIVWSVLTIILLIVCIASKRRVYRNYEYKDAKLVALYLKKYHELPKNYITKEDLNYSKNHNISTEGKIVGGDKHFSADGLEKYRISDKDSLRECDIYSETYNILDRPAERFVYTCNTSNVRVFETTDHYATYNRELTKFAIMPFHYIMIICTIVHFIASGVIVWIIYKPYFAIFKKVKEDTIDVDVIEEN